MAAKPGEENVATLFGDIHYFYGPETDNPPHHRFNKGSYVYLFENALARRTRIEVANRPGTEHQDAFDGYLDCTSVSYSYRHSCMVSLTVHDVPGQDEWHLPTYDPHNQNMYHYKLSSLDIYFWTPRDAVQFVNGVRRLLPANQLDIEDEPLPPPPPPPVQQQQHYAAAPQNGDVSHVVRKLESVALAEDKEVGAVSTAPAAPATSTTSAAPAVLSFAPPPMSTMSTASADTDSQPHSAVPGSISSSSNTPASTFAPMAYNPAAPAAPEAIRPREKTPPPEDATHDPLHQTLYQDAATPFSPGLVVPAGLGPLSPGVPPPAFQPPPGAPSFPGPPPPPSSNYDPSAMGGAPVGAPIYGHPGLVHAATMPASPFGSGFPGSPGFSQYNYNSPAAAVAPAAGDYSVHQQLYRPTGQEAMAHTPKQEPRGRLEENAGRIERGVTGMLKKLEKKFG